MPRSHFPIAMYRYGAMQGAGGSGAGAPTYALKGDGAAVYGLFATTQVLAAGDTATIVFANTFDNTSSGTNIFLMFGATIANAGFIRQEQANNSIAYNALTTSGATLDGVAITSSVTPYPTDGLSHEIVLTASAAFEIGYLYRRDTGAYSQSAILSLSTNTVARGVETWNFNTRSLTVIEEEGTGSDINLFGVAADDWVTIPL